MTLKGTVSRDVLLLVNFMNQFPPAPGYLHGQKDFLNGQVQYKKAFDVLLQKYSNMYSWRILFTGRISSEMVCLLKPPSPSPFPLPSPFQKLIWNSGKATHQTKEKKKTRGTALLSPCYNLGGILEKGKAFKVFSGSCEMRVVPPGLLGAAISWELYRQL
jgi:hypothetical protein